MPITDYRTLGRSGLVVSPLALGTMTFGTGRWGTDEDGARAIFDAYRAAGGNLIDTADVYGGGASEEIVGRLIRDADARDAMVLSTKVGFDGGAGAKNVHRALEGSLRRLGTDHVDLYWMHVWDGVTPAEEVARTMDALVRSGRVRYYALSDMPAWFASKVATIAAERGWAGPVAIQVEYSLVARDVEGEHVPAAREAGMAVMPWSPLAGGFLTGKYARDEPDGGGRLRGPNPFGDSKFTDRNWRTLDVLKAVAGEIDRPPAQVALAWVMSRPGVGSTLVGARDVAQLHGSLSAADVALSPEQTRRLDEASAPPLGFTADLAAPAVRRMVLGGRDVRGWGE